MGKTKKSDGCNQPDDTNNLSDSPSIEEARKALSISYPTDFLNEYVKTVRWNIDDMLPNGLFQSEFESIQDLSRAIGLNSLDSYIEPIKIVQPSTDDYLKLLSNKYKSLENLKISASSVNNLLKSEPGTVSQDKIEKELKNLGKAKVSVDEANKGVALASRISTQGYQYLKKTPDLCKNFEGNLINTTVVSIDIRSSTQLMLNAKSPKDFVTFISDLSTALSALVKSSCGVYDKFTGDGLLCFFPSFYSGENHVYLALLFAESCHKMFQKLYATHFDKFSVVRSDVGLGIGIDVGDTYLTFVNYEPTVIGTSVVYACRLSGAPCNTTYVNQQVYEAVKNKYEENFVLTSCEMDFKGQGKMRVYNCSLMEELDPIPLPDWAMDEVKETNESKEKV